MLVQQFFLKFFVCVGVVGLVYIYVYWIFGWVECGDIEIVGIVEFNWELVECYVKQYGFFMDLVYLDLESMLEVIKFEVVIVFNIIYGYLEVVEVCVLRGIYVMVEKLLAVNLEYVWKMEFLVQEYNILLLINYEIIWYGFNYKVKLFVDEGVLGLICKMVIYDGYEGLIEIGCNLEFIDWFCDLKWNGGGVIIDFGCYGVNLLIWLMKGECLMFVFVVIQ